MNQLIIENSIEKLQYKLSGFGDPYDTCQKYGYRAHNAGNNEWHYHKYKHSCHRFECPECDKDWRQTEKMNIFDRLMVYASNTGRSIVHYIASPIPRNVDSAYDYKKLRKEGYRILRKSGVAGGVAIFHYFRHPSSLNDRSEIQEHNPHWHILGDGWRNDTLFDDWIVKRVGIRRSKGQLLRTIDYCLFWASKAFENEYTVADDRGTCLNANLSNTKIEIETWFGTMAYNKLKVEKYIGDGIYCPVCEQNIRFEDWYEINWLHGDPPDDSGILPHGMAEIEISFRNMKL